MGDLKESGGENTLCKEILGRVLDVVIRKGRHGIVGVVIVRLVADIQALDACIPGRSLKVLGQELTLLVEVVASALEIVIRDHFDPKAKRYLTYDINQNVQGTSGPLLNQLSGIVLLPLVLLVITEVALEGLLSPRAVRGVCDRRKGRDGLVLARVAKELGMVSVIESGVIQFCCEIKDREKEMG